MQSLRGSCRETFSNSPAVRASTGGASSLNASGRLLARTTRSVISSSPRCRLRSGEASSSSTTLVSDIDTPPPPAACNKSGNLSRAGTGEGHRSLPSRERCRQPYAKHGFLAVDNAWVNSVHFLYVQILEDAGDGAGAHTFASANRSRISRSTYKRLATTPRRGWLDSMESHERPVYRLPRFSCTAKRQCDGERSRLRYACDERTS